MMLKYFFLLSILLCMSNAATEVTNLIGTSLQECLNCLCHARTGCWNRLTCASYSVNQDYWKRAGKPKLNLNSNDDTAFRDCMRNENCVLNTIKLYTESFGEIDCNYDGYFNCKDRFAIHVFGQNCRNPNYGSTYAKRFNHCASSIGVSDMQPVEVGPDAE